MLLQGPRRDWRTRAMRWLVQPVALALLVSVITSSSAFAHHAASRKAAATRPHAARPGSEHKPVQASRAAARHSGHAKVAAAEPQEPPPPRVDVNRVIAQIVASRAKAGGPYVAARKGKVIAAKLDPAAVHSLPLASPLDHYQFESGFGIRTDPINGEDAVHTGIDLSAPYRTPVHSTAPGRVVFAGYAAGYGNMVEIDHGNGVHTRYGHLNSIKAKVGQRIGSRSVVGLLGSTGRSTGPHVHYEVLVNGLPQDPERFLRAGRAAGVINASTAL